MTLSSEDKDNNDDNASEQEVQQVIGGREVEQELQGKVLDQYQCPV